MTSRALVRIAFLTGAVLILVPLVDLLTNTWPWAVGNATWRYGTYTLVSGFLLTPLLGLALIGGTARVMGHPRTAKVVAVTGLLLGLLLLVTTVLFMADTLKLLPTVPTDAVGQFRVTVGKAVFKNLTMAAAVGVIAWVAWRGHLSSKSSDWNPLISSS